MTITYRDVQDKGREYHSIFGHIALCQLFADFSATTIKDLKFQDYERFCNRIDHAIKINRKPFREEQFIVLENMTRRIIDDAYAYAYNADKWQDPEMYELVFKAYVDIKTKLLCASLVEKAILDK